MKKKILIAGMAVLIAVLFVTCEEFFPVDDEDAIIGYTDVQYLDGGQQVKVWLDGSKPVPVTKRSQRAMSTDLSKMAYDYLEVIFVSGSTIARSQWELGQSAGISGIKRSTGTPTPSPDYKYVSDASDDYALMAVGTKDNKTLLGVGIIGSVDGTPAFPTVAANVYIKPDTEYVTFYLTSVKSGLIATGETIGAASATTNPVGALFSSFTGPTGSTSSRTSLGDSQYPMYGFTASQIAADPMVAVTANYVFGGAADIYSKELILQGKPVTAERRIPRYLYSGRYMVAKGLVNTKTTVTVGTYSSFSATVPLSFMISGKGIFSFFIDIPVYLKLATAGTNGGALKPVPWHVRSGFGSELYSLDDGAGSGGCVLMGIGVTNLDWLDITWEWVTP